MSRVCVYYTRESERVRVKESESESERERERREERRERWERRKERKERSATGFMTEKRGGASEQEKKGRKNETAYRRDSSLCSYLKINLPRDGTTSFWAAVLLHRVVQLTHPSTSWLRARARPQFIDADRFSSLARLRIFRTCIGHSSVGSDRHCSATSVLSISSMINTWTTNRESGPPVISSKLLQSYSAPVMRINDFPQYVLFNCSPQKRLCDFNNCTIKNRSFFPWFYC